MRHIPLACQVVLLIGLIGLLIHAAVAHLQDTLTSYPGPRVLVTVMAAVLLVGVGTVWPASARRRAKVAYSVGALLTAVGLAVAVANPESVGLDVVSVALQAVGLVMAGVGGVAVSRSPQRQGGPLRA